MIDDNSILETALEKMGIDTSAIKESRLAEEREEIRKSGSQDLIKIRGGSRGFLSRVFKYFASGVVIDTLINAGVRGSRDNVRGRYGLFTLCSEHRRGNY